MNNSAQDNEYLSYPNVDRLSGWWKCTNNKEYENYLQKDELYRVLAENKEGSIYIENTLALYNNGMWVDKTRGVFYNHKPYTPVVASSVMQTMCNPPNPIIEFGDANEYLVSIDLHRIQTVSTYKTTGEVVLVSGVTYKTDSDTAQHIRDKWKEYRKWKDVAKP